MTSIPGDQGGSTSFHDGRSEKRSERIARQIASDIAARQLSPGAMLPREAEMLQDYKAARGTLREALRILEVHGLITVKPGRGGGPVVQEVDGIDYGRMSTLYFLIRRVTFREVVEARLAIEPVLARLAAHRQDPTTIDQLERAIEATAAVTARADDRYLSLSATFHEALISLSGNAVLDLYASSLAAVFRDRVQGSVFPPEDRERVHRAHQSIAYAIIAGDADTAEAEMRAHMEEFMDFWAQRHPGLLNEVVGWS